METSGRMLFLNIDKGEIVFFIVSLPFIFFRENGDLNFSRSNKISSAYTSVAAEPLRCIDFACQDKEAKRKKDLNLPLFWHKSYHLTKFVQPLLFLVRAMVMII